MNPPVYKARIYLYCFLLLWTILLFALSVARLSYTEHIPRGDPLNNGVNFFDPSVVALLVSSLLGLIFVPFMIYTLHTEYSHPLLTLVYTEIISAFVIWIIWLGSTAAATNVWPNLSFCAQFRACTNLQAMIAFAWLGWITFSALLLLTIVTVARNNAWRDHVHGPWADRPLVFGDSSRISGRPVATPDWGYVGSARESGAQLSGAQVSGTQISGPIISAPQMSSASAV